MKLSKNMKKVQNFLKSKLDFNEKFSSHDIDFLLDWAQMSDQPV